MDMMLKPRCNRRTVDGERVSSTEKSTDESVKDQGNVGCVF